MHDGDGDGDGRLGRETEARSLDLRSLKVISVLGRGAKGVVFLVRTERGQMLALKAVLRSPIKERRNKKLSAEGEEYRRVSFEREVLSSFRHPLLPKLHGVLKTEAIVGYAIDYCPGRDLNVLRKMQTEKMFSPDIIRFYAAELILALEYVHGLGIVYRDLKPENVLIQDNGHLMLVDFDLSTKLSAAKSPETRPPPPSNTQTKPRKKKKFTCFFHRRGSGISPEYSVQPAARSPSHSESSSSDSVQKSNSFVGTEEYVAPEIILGNGHDFAVDLWCLGVMLYEMLYGATPFRGPTRKDTFYRIITKTPDLTGEATPLRDLIRKLLDKDARKRITIQEIKGHDFFKSVDWDSILQIPRPPFIPQLTDVAPAYPINQIDVPSYVQSLFQADDEKHQKNNKHSTNMDDSCHPKQINNDHFFVF